MNEEKGVKISIPIITKKELENISKNYDNFLNDICNAVVHEKDLLILQTIVKEQKSKQEKIEKELKQENRKKHIVISEYQDLLEREKEKNKKLEEVIDLMAEDISNRICEGDLDNIYEAIHPECDSGMERNWLEKMPTSDIKQYYFKKAKGEII